MCVHLPSSLALPKFIQTTLSRRAQPHRPGPRAQEGNAWFFSTEEEPENAAGEAGRLDGRTDFLTVTNSPSMCQTASSVPASPKQAGAEAGRVAGNEVNTCWQPG